MAVNRVDVIVKELRPCNAVYYRNKLHGDTLEYQGIEYQRTEEALSLTGLQELVESHDLDEFLFVDHFSGYRPKIYVGHRTNLALMYSLFVSAGEPFRNDLDWGVVADKWVARSGRYLVLFGFVC